jgi:DNA-binding CsgD family transcriptional regulator
MSGDVIGGEVEILCAAELPAQAVADYRRHYRTVDLWTNRATAAFARATQDAGLPPVLTSGEMLVPEPEFVRSEFYRDFGRHYGLRYVVGTVVPLGEAGAMPIGLHRPDGAEPFGTDEKRVVEALLPHLRRALQLRHRLIAAHGAGRPMAPAGLAALDGLRLGVLVLDAELHVLLANATAEAIVAEPDGPLRFVRIAGTRRGVARTGVAPRLRQDADRFAALVRATALGGGAGGAVRLRDGAERERLAALIAPLPRRLADGAGGQLGRVADRALVLLRHLRATAPRPALLRDLFGLTRAEAEVAQALAGGASKRAVAAARGLRETTVRTQVRAVLDKTGTAKLRDLEQLLARLDGL